MESASLNARTQRMDTAMFQPACHAGRTALLALAAMSAGAASVPPRDLAEAQLRAINHRAVNALANADRSYFEVLVAQDFLSTAPNGEWLGRGAHLERLGTTAPAESFAYSDLRVRVFGDVALVHGLKDTNRAGGPPQRVRYTDVYQWDGMHWHLVNTQHTPLRDGISPLLQRSPAPPHPAWQGSDPTGDDLEVLRELNENYVRAFREADVAWYDAHLAPDFVVVSPDGSMQDRARALADFAEPAFATYLRSFPVDKVRIRRFGDIALIHAENAYERKDGRRGVNRYTDIWQKRPDGRWHCLAAHITVRKAPA